MMGFVPQFEHERYEELCALATANVLTPLEAKELSAHLEICAECREASAQYGEIAKGGMSFLAGHFAASDEDRLTEFDETLELNRLMQAIEQTTPDSTRPRLVVGRKAVWGWAWPAALAAASITLGVALGINWTEAHGTSRFNALKAESRSALDRLLNEKHSLEATAATENQQIAVLEQQESADKSAVSKLRDEADQSAGRLAELTTAMSAEKKDSQAQTAALLHERDEMVHERDEIAGKLRDAQKMYQTVQDELNASRGQHQQDLLHLASLEKNVDSLTAELRDQNKQTKTDEQYLASDKDIRDLIGARNLYIADIMDVSESGRSRKPFGRVFYTQTKSLIFYAYDLDLQPGVKRTSTFQVWGRADTKDRNPINLGILYMDNETNRRWTLRVNDPTQLARLDAVFVTVEPSVQSGKPTGKPFLYASLRREPNHP